LFKGGISWPLKVLHKKDECGQYFRDDRVKYFGLPKKSSLNSSAIVFPPKKVEIFGSTFIERRPMFAVLTLW
jgi:hypothetical protein